MSHEIFAQIMVLSGTDYNVNNDTSLSETMKHYYEYQLSLKGQTLQSTIEPLLTSHMSFYKWLQTNTTYIVDYEILKQIYNMFVLDLESEVFDLFKTINIKLNPINIPEIQKTMHEQGFIFVN
jgi:hypothetical protein